MRHRSREKKSVNVKTRKECFFNFNSKVDDEVSGAVFISSKKK